MHNITARLSFIEEKMKNASIAGQLDAARAVQQSHLIPNQSIPGITLHHHYRSAEKTGGDWYGNYYDEETTIMFTLIGDVTGHGLSSALVAAAAAGSAGQVFESIRNQPTDLASKLLTMAQSLNQSVVYSGAPSDKRMSMLFLAINTQTGEACYINAAHHPIFHRNGNGEIDVLCQPGYLLGEKQAKFIPIAFNIKPGDLLCLVTDGICENPLEGGRSIGQRGLINLLKDVGEISNIHQSLQETVNRFTINDETDDSAFILIEWQPERGIKKQSA